MKTLLHLCVLLPLILTSTAFAKRKHILVGAYGFAPYYDLEKGRGLTNDVLEILNSLQDEYTFSVTEIPSKRRYQSFTDNKVDMILFEDPRWGWKKIPHWEFETNTQDAEIYIAHKKNALNQSYFDSLKDKKIAGILGYHYGFANFNSDENFLRSKFNISLVSHNVASVRLVLHDRVELAVVPRSFIRLYVKEYPNAKAELLLSDKVDQTYDLKFLVNPKTKMDKKFVTGLMRDLLADPRYQKLLAEIL
jgi:ABC-type amino acid transport substrate-binding protein